MDLLLHRYGGVKTHDSGHNSTRPTWIYTFPQFGSAQVAIPLNRSLLSIYIRGASTRGQPILPVLASVSAEVLEDYAASGRRPVSSLTSTTNAPYLSPEIPGNQLLRVAVPSIEALRTVMDAYFDILGSASGPFSPKESDESEGAGSAVGPTLGSTAQTILDLLIAHLDDVHPGRPETYLGYKQIHCRASRQLGQNG